MTCIFYPFFPSTSGQIFENGPESDGEVHYIDVSQYQNQINMINAAFAQAAEVTAAADFTFPNSLGGSSGESSDESGDDPIDGVIDGEFLFEDCTCEGAADGGYCQCYYDNIDRRLEAAAAEANDDGEGEYDSGDDGDDPEDGDRSELRAASDSIQPPFVNPSDFNFAAEATAVEVQAPTQQKEQYFGCITNDGVFDEIVLGEGVFEFEEDDGDVDGDGDDSVDSDYEFFVY